jgi:F420H(2)-dependent quinone reductase
MTWWERRYYAVVNAVMRLLLRSPLHSLRSAHIILLEFTGRRSGRRYRMPVSYWQRGDAEVICLTSTAWSRWWVNLDDAPVAVVLRGATRAGRCELVAETGRRRELVSGFLRHNAQDAHHYGVDTDPQGQPTSGGLTALADSPVTKVMRIGLDPAPA